MPVSIYGTTGGDDIYKPELWAMESLEIFHDNLGIRAAVNIDFSKEVANKGDTVNTRIPALFVANDTGSSGEVESANIQNPKATNVPVVMDTNKEVTFGIRDVSDATSLKSLRNEFMEPSVIAFLEAIEDHAISVMSNTTSGFGDTTDSNVIETVGTGNAPDTFQLFHIANAARLLDDAKVPNRLRYMCISPKQQEDLITDGGEMSTALLMKSNEIGGESALRERRIGRLQGFDILMQQGIITTADAAGTSVYPNGSWDRALFWYKNAVTHIVRPLPTPPTNAGAAVAVQSYDGASIRVSLQYQLIQKRLLVSLDGIWGWKVLRQDGGGSIITLNTAA